MTANIVVKNHTMVYYPEDELHQLRKVLKLRGIQEQILSHTGIAKSTVSRISKKGMGTWEKVSQLRQFVIEFNELQNFSFAENESELIL